MATEEALDSHGVEFAVDYVAARCEQICYANLAFKTLSAFSIPIQPIN